MILPSSTTTQATGATSRGAFVLLEGVDRCGKTTQCSRLLTRLVAAGMAATSMRFPDRTTATGTIINNYLQSGTHLDDNAIHLLFSANRWEASNVLKQHLLNGTTVICDRYAYSGVAFSSAKVDEISNKQLLDIDWCKAPDRGLPAPDCVIFLDISQEDAEKRGGYGGERYENRDMQTRVREQFRTLQSMDEGIIPWTVINAAQSIEQVEEEIYSIVSDTLNRVTNQPIQALWINK